MFLFLFLSFRYLFYSLPFWIRKGKGSLMNTSLNGQTNYIGETEAGKREKKAQD